MLLAAFALSNSTVNSSEFNILKTPPVNLTWGGNLKALASIVTGFLKQYLGRIYMLIKA